ncbi:hypothetical protein [uncultured Nostoc sp.]
MEILNTTKHRPALMFIDFGLCCLRRQTQAIAQQLVCKYKK